MITAHAALAAALEELMEAIDENLSPTDFGGVFGDRDNNSNIDAAMEAARVALAAVGIKA